MSVTYFVAVPFDRNDDGNLAAGEAREATSAIAAERGARVNSLCDMLVPLRSRAPATCQRASLRTRLASRNLGMLT
jgi:hypothetical protein